MQIITATDYIRFRGDYLIISLAVHVCLRFYLRLPLNRFFTNYKDIILMIKVILSLSSSLMI